MKSHRLCCRILLRALTVALLSGLSSCASTTAVSKSLATESESDGWIVGTIGAKAGALFARSGTAYNDQALYFARIGAQGAGRIHFNVGEVFGLDKDFHDKEESANVFMQRLPAGDYVLVSMEFWANYGLSGMLTQREPITAPLRFRVLPRQATYLGSFIASTDWPPGVLRMNPGLGYFVVYDRSQRDIPAITKAYPEIAKILVAQPAVSGTQTIELRSNAPTVDGASNQHAPFTVPYRQ